MVKCEHNKQTQICINEKKTKQKKIMERLNEERIRPIFKAMMEETERVLN